jgi:formylglycine-generating enzyme required for sulfatase activity
MVRIPAGTFSMGDPLGDCYTETQGPYDELPLHPVALGSFCMDETEVTKALWDEVYSWAVTNGYSFDNPGSAKGPAYPVQNISWYDAVKWCNARSEKEGLTPCYCRSVAQITVYRNGQVDIENDWVRWPANGYRLPTEAQWEYAARGGAVGRRFPWSDVDTVTHSRANYCSTPELPYDVSPTRGYHPDYQAGGFGYTSPARSFSANGYGLYDLAGNVEEWCWDAYDAGYYGVSPAAFPIGPNVGNQRVVRGGSSEGQAFLMRCAKRWNWNAFVALSDLGFRCVR